MIVSIAAAAWYHGDAKYFEKAYERELHGRQVLQAQAKKKPRRRAGPLPALALSKTHRQPAIAALQDTTTTTQ